MTLGRSRLRERGGECRLIREPSTNGRKARVNGFGGRFRRHVAIDFGELQLPLDQPVER
jgi:hypothetical protein